MRLLDTFAGIGGFSLGLERAGMATVAICEKDKHAQKILKRHYPKTPIIGDIHDVRKNDLSTIDIISGGTPCQDLSIAGNRKGLTGEKSGLFFEWLRVVAEIKPRWIFWENVAGALHANSGRDFATILIQLQKLGYSLAWRVLDAQWFGVPQRRRRVFIVGHFTDGCAAQVLFEREGGAGRTESSRTSQKTHVNNVRGGIKVYRKVSHGEYVEDTVSSTISARDYKDATDLIVFNSHVSSGYSLSESKAISPTIISTNKGGATPPSIAFRMYAQAESGLAGSNRQPALAIYKRGVRRLTPVECERLQGFPQGWTGGQADTHRYKQLGNAVAVPVVEAIARRIMAVEAQQVSLEKEAA